MSKSVTIPSSDQDLWICRINHKEYSYPAGTTQTVPDEVAELIEAIYASEEEPSLVDKSKWAVYSQGGWNEVPSGLPDASEASNGDVLTIDAGEPAWKAPSGGGGNSPLIVKATGTATVDTSDPQETIIKIASDKSVQEIADALDVSDFKGVIVIFPEITDSNQSPYRYDGNIYAEWVDEILFNNGTYYGRAVMTDSSNNELFFGLDGSVYMFRITITNLN